MKIENRKIQSKKKNKLRSIFIYNLKMKRKRKIKYEQFSLLFTKTCYWSHMVYGWLNWHIEKLNMRYWKIHYWDPSTTKPMNSKRIEHWSSICVYFNLEMLFLVGRCTCHMYWRMYWVWLKIEKKKPRVFVACFVPMVRIHCKLFFFSLGSHDLH